MSPDFRGQQLSSIPQRFRGQNEKCWANDKPIYWPNNFESRLLGAYTVVKQPWSIETILIDKELVEVDFVMDYIQLRFWGVSSRSYAGVPALTINEPPVATRDGVTLNFPDPGSRDMICCFIGDSISELRLDEEKEIVLVFNSGGIIRIPLVGVMAYSGLESAVFNSEDDGSVCEVW